MNRIKQSQITSVAECLEIFRNHTIARHIYFLKPGLQSRKVQYLFRIVAKFLNEILILIYSKALRTIDQEMVGYLDIQSKSTLFKVTIPSMLCTVKKGITCKIITI